MEVNFKFEIGQFVFVRQELLFWHETYGYLEEKDDKRGYQSMGTLAAGERKPRAGRILERHLQECYGGVQLHYSIRAGSNVLSITEPELTADFYEPALVPAKKEKPSVD